MTVIDRMREWVVRALSVTDEKAWNPSLWVLAGSQSLSGEVVTEYSALTYSAVYNAVSLISGTIGALPLHLMQRKGERKRIADDRKLYRVMHDQPNEYMTAMAFRETLMTHVLTWGNGFAEIVRNGYGEVAALWPITPNRVRIATVGDELVYVIRVGNEDRTFSRESILHVPGLGFDGFQGYSVVAMARKSLGLGMALETFGSRYFGNGTHPGLVISHPGKLSATAHDNLKKSLTEAYSGLGNSHRLMLMEEGMKPEKIGVPPDDSQFLESRQFQIPEVARWFNLPPHKLKDLTRSSFSNIESEQQSFYVDSILPWLVRLEQNYNAQLLTEYDRDMSGRGRYYFKHVVEGILRGDTAARGEFYSKMFNIGVMSINEIREKEDMDPVEGGDIHLVPLNMTTLENAGEKLEPKEPPPPPTLPPDDTEDADEEPMARLAERIEQKVAAEVSTVRTEAERMISVASSTVKEALRTMEQMRKDSESAHERISDRNAESMRAFADGMSRMAENQPREINVSAPEVNIAPPAITMNVHVPAGKKSVSFTRNGDGTVTGAEIAEE